MSTEPERPPDPLPPRHGLLWTFAIFNAVVIVIVVLVLTLPLSANGDPTAEGMERAIGAVFLVLVGIAGNVVMASVAGVRAARRSLRMSTILRGAPRDQVAPPDAQPTGVPPARADVVAAGHGRTNPLAGTAVAFGLLFFVPFVAPVVAIVTGYMARSVIGRSDGRERGVGLTKAGIVLGWIFLALDTMVLAALTVSDRCDYIGAPGDCGSGLGSGELVIGGSSVLLSLVVHFGVEGFSGHPRSATGARPSAIRIAVTVAIGSAVVFAAVSAFIGLSIPTNAAADEFDSIELPDGWVMVVNNDRQGRYDVDREYQVADGLSHALGSLSVALHTQGFEAVAPAVEGIPPCALTVARNAKELDVIPERSDFIVPTESDPYGCPNEGDDFIVIIHFEDRRVPPIETSPSAIVSSPSTSQQPGSTPPLKEEFGGIALPEGWVLIAEDEGEGCSPDQGRSGPSGCELYRVYHATGGLSLAMRSLKAALQAQGFGEVEPLEGIPPCALTVARNGKELDAIPESDPSGGLCPDEGEPFAVVLSFGIRYAP